MHRSRLIGLDASTHSVGWAVFEDGLYFSSGVFKPGEKGFAAIRNYALWLEKFIAEIGPQEVFYERPSGVRSKRADILLGAMWYQTWLLWPNLKPVSPMEIRKTGYSKLSSIQVLTELKNDVVIKRRKDVCDELDAIGCVIAGMRRYLN